jgi:sugar/nucleoside kinase (ribokinase family)
MGILVVGSAALDTVKTPFGTQDDGGSATYFSIAASYFTDVSMVAVVGGDFPEEHISFLRRKGIDISGIQSNKGKTFRWKGEYGSDLNTRTALDTQLNVFADFEPKLSSAHRMHKYLFLGNIDPDLQFSVLEQMDQPKFVACDTMNIWINNKRDSLLKTLKRIDLLIINDEKARLLAGNSSILKAAKQILGMGPKKLVIKRGEYGAIMFSSRSIFTVPAFPIENVIDPTGAGDTFAGGLMGYLANLSTDDEISLRRAVVFGSIMASFNVTDFGAKQLGELTFKEIDSRYREFCRMTFFDNFSIEDGKPLNVRY